MKETSLVPKQESFRSPATSLASISVIHTSIQRVILVGYEPESNYPNSIRSEGNDFSDNFAIAVSVIFLILYLLFLAKRHRSEKSKGRFNVLVNEQES